MQRARTAELPAARAAMTGRLAGRLALGGLALVLVMLASVSVWGVQRTQDATRLAARASKESSLFDRARFDVASEEALERGYEIAPDAGVRDQFTTTANGLARTAAPDPGDRLGLGPLDREHRARRAGALPRAVPAALRGRRRRQQRTHVRRRRGGAAARARHRGLDLQRRSERTRARRRPRWRSSAATSRRS